MREQVKDLARLLHILESIDNIYEFAERKTFEQIENDKMCFFAIAYQLCRELSDALSRMQPSQERKVRFS